MNVACCCSFISISKNALEIHMTLYCEQVAFDEIHNSDS